MLKIERNCQIHMGQGTKKKIPKAHVDFKSVGRKNLIHNHLKSKVQC